MDDKFKKQFPTRKELEIVSSTREWKKLDNAARVITKFFREIRRWVDILWITRKDAEISNII